jgi:GntR family transcriptional regulator/MocR family aminotransferase
MSSEWSNLVSGLDLHLDLDKRRGRSAAIETALRDAIRTGRLPAGSRLPPTRALAGDLGVARGTVAEAYAQLAAEGFLHARQGSGTTVADTTTQQQDKEDEIGDRAADPRPPRADLRVGRSDAAAFPRAAWVRSLRRALRDAPPTALEGADSRGNAGLRTHLAAYLGRARGVVADPRRVVVTAGFQQGCGVIFEALATGGAHTIALEDPCMFDCRALARRAGLEVVALEVDEQGARTDTLAEYGTGVDAVMVTPAHQFPLGATLAPERRAALVEWARDTDGWAIEDDYDGEFRYDRQPVGALQGLDPDRVIYAGTASKTLAPGVRVGWLVLPEQLLEPAVTAKYLADRTTSALDQLTLGDMIASGAYDSHLRRMRATYRRRRDALLNTVAINAPNVEALGIAAGLHVVLQLPDGTSEADMLARAAEHELAIMGTTEFWHDPDTRPLQGLVAGYGSSPEHAYPAALDALAAVLAGSFKRRRPPLTQPSGSTLPDLPGREG